MVHGHYAASHNFAPHTYCHNAPFPSAQAIGALAAWRSQPPPTFLSSFTAHIQPRLPLYGAADLHLLLGSLAALGFLPQRDWVVSWLAAAQPQLRYFGPQGIINATRCFSVWQLRPPKEFMQARAMPHNVHTCCRLNPQTLSK